MSAESLKARRWLHKVCNADLIRKPVCRETGTRSRRRFNHRIFFYALVLYLLPYRSFIQWLALSLILTTPNFVASTRSSPRLFNSTYLMVSTSLSHSIWSQVAIVIQNHFHVSSPKFTPARLGEALDSVRRSRQQLERNEKIGLGGKGNQSIQ